MSRNAETKILEADFVVIGAGFAGVSTAYHLARQSRGRKVVLLEKENVAGMHASGRNAGMVRQVTPQEAISELARKGSQFIRSPAEFLGRSAAAELFRPSGSLLFASGERARQLQEDIASARAAGLDVEELAPAAVRKRYPVLERASLELGCFCPSDGVVDLPALVGVYVDAAREAGVRVVLGTTVEEVPREGNSVRGIRSANVMVHAPVVINAAGPWASEVGNLAGASAMPLRPTRRHLFVTEPLDWVDPDWPFLWNTSAEVYLRPEEGGLLLSPCDESEAGDKDSDTADEQARQTLRVKLQEQFPSLRGVSFARGWSGLRTLTPDGRFVIGPDPRLDSFFWVAGLGGHGVTSSYAVGELAAELILHPQKDAANPHSPSRFRDDP